MTPDSPHGQRLAADELDRLLTSADNADRKGAQQYFTRPEIAEALLRAWPEPSRCYQGVTGARLTVADLTGHGGGALLTAACNRLGHSLFCGFGADIDPRFRRRPRAAQGDWQLAAPADITRLAPLLHETNFRPQYLVANPPFGLRWHAERLAYLADSRIDEIRRAWPEDSRSGRIDSTLASYLIALDCLHHSGDGMLITLWSTYQRLIAPHPAADAIWQAVRIGEARAVFANGDQLREGYELAVLYFAPGHFGGCRHVIPVSPERSTLAGIFYALDNGNRRSGRRGASPSPTLEADQASRAWEAAVGEHHRRYVDTEKPAWNLSLTPSGRIRAYLTPFDTVTGHLPHELVGRLNSLRDQTPMSLVVQRASRDSLLAAVSAPEWRVQPELVDAVHAAVAAYQAERSPLYPLPEIQRLGYLDEEDAVECRASGLGDFVQGQRYPIETRTESATQKTTILSATGETQTVERTGRELVLSVFPTHHKSLEPHRFVVGGEYRYASTPHPDQSDHVHTLETFLAHFRVPDVPDIAAAIPDRYRENLTRLDQIEALIDQNLNRN